MVSSQEWWWRLYNPFSWPAGFDDHEDDHVDDGHDDEESVKDDDEDSEDENARLSWREEV